jgi:2,4-dienoyl-CoA reductase-like NADH-dependent reductase (Old Yellow Enzyme family)
MIQVSGFKWTRERPKNGPYYFEAAKKLAEVVNIPVLLIGGIKSYDEAEYILNNSNIEYIGLSRGLLCEPDLVKKWKNGDKIKAKCVSCNNCLKDFFGMLIVFLIRKKEINRIINIKIFKNFIKKLMIII